MFERPSVIGIAGQDAATQRLRLVEPALANPDHPELGGEDDRVGPFPDGLGHPGFHLPPLGLARRRGVEDEQRGGGHLLGTAGRPGLLEDRHRLDRPILAGQEPGQGEDPFRLPGFAGDECLVGGLGLLREPVTIQEVGHGTDLVGDFAASGLQERQELGLALPQVEESRLQFQGCDSLGLGLLQLGEPAIGLVELVAADPVVDEVGQMLWVPDLEVQELDHLALVLFFVGLAQVELGQQEPLVGIQQVRGAELFEDLDGLATTAGSKGEYVWP